MPSLITLNTYENAQLAYLDRATLAESGIDAVVEESNYTALYPGLNLGLGGIQLKVREEDFDRAQSVLSAQNGSEEVVEIEGEEEQETKPVCPQCGLADTSERKSLFMAFIFMILFFLPNATSIQKFRCNKCGYTWKI